MTFAVDGGRNKPKYITKVQLHQNRVQCFFVLCGRDRKILAARVFCHVVHNLRLLTDVEAEIWRPIVPYTEHNARGFQKVIDQLVQFPMRLSCMISMQEYDHRQRLRISAICVSDDEPNYFAERDFSNLISRGRTSFKRYRFECIG